MTRVRSGRGGGRPKRRTASWFSTVAVHRLAWRSASTAAARNAKCSQVDLAPGGQEVDRHIGTVVGDGLSDLRAIARPLTRGLRARIDGDGRPPQPRPAFLGSPASLSETRRMTGCSARDIRAPKMCGAAENGEVRQES